MKNNFELVIGIEVHVVLNSKSKMFSNSLSSHFGKTNTNINPIDLGLPGTMPSVNEACVLKAIKLATALKMDVANKINFDRKNYFYQDLPKGFQITQQFNPIGKNGIIELENNSVVEIERIHLEEDTAKQIIEDDQIYLDYNRAGMPLIEIVTKPCIKSAFEAAMFLKQLRRILIFNNISDAKMEDGSMRADVNISIKPIGSKKFGTRVEIKNINSITNVEKAIMYEYDLQLKQTLLNQPVLMATKRFNDKTLQTEFMRLKTLNVDYHYMTEPNIYIREINQDFINKALIDFKDVYQIKKELLELNVSNEFINLFLDNSFLYYQFLKAFSVIKDATEVIRWICIEFVGAINKMNLNLLEVNETKFDELIKMMSLLKENKINGKQAKEIIKFIIETNKDVNQIILENNFKQITDVNVLKPILLKHIELNPNMVKQYFERTERVEKFFIGMVMKETNGQANPDVINQLLKQELNK